jgi:hypothetical protein
VEGAINAKPSPAYAAQKAALGGRARQSLDLAEEAVAVDPHHRVRRLEVDGVTFDLNEPGIILGFVIEGQTVVYLSYLVLFEP